MTEGTMSGGDTPIPYRPSNGDEGISFMARFCDCCKRDAAYQQGIGDSCPIAAAALAYMEDEEGYPPEWVSDQDESNPRCTAFDPEDHVQIADSRQGTLDV